jgi:dihydrofolate synthase / folylpolyglutamate synthase
MNMTYKEAEAYINSVPKFTSKNKPENTMELIRRLGHPERHMKVIHVAGTNGKGSVCAFLSSMLTEGGKRTGLFTSPHLVKINERFQINNEPVSDEIFLDAYERVMKLVEEMQKDGFYHPAYFELLFAIGMVIFEKAQVEYLILETGLGGRLDATNIVEKPVVTVITSISLDHTEILGDTIEEIAGEKAGIIKQGIPIVYDGREKRAEKVILQKAEEENAKAVPLYEEKLSIQGSTDHSVDYLFDESFYQGHVITVPYPAPYQVRNSALALLAMEEIDPQHEIGLETRLQAIRDTRWQGRMETVLPGVIVDGAHNEDGVHEFVRTLRQVGSSRRIVMLFSAVVEKNYEKMVHTICDTGCIQEVVVTEIHGSRIVPAEELAAVFRKFTSVPVTAISSIEEAFDTAMEKKGDGLLFCVGSLYLVGEVKKVIEEKKHD